jgi:hypothetical protein
MNLLINPFAVSPVTSSISGPNILNTVSLHSSLNMSNQVPYPYKTIPHPTFEDGPNRGFRNVGKPQTDAVEIPKRTYTRLSQID